VVFDKLGMVSY